MNTRTPIAQDELRDDAEGMSYLNRLPRRIVVVYLPLAVFVFGVPMRGSLAALLLLSAVFMVPALGQGLLISSLARNQFLAAQIALFTGFLPAFMLSGFLYEIDAMPAPIRAITRLVPARYFVDSLKTVFLAGDIWAVFLPNLAAMAAIGGLFFVIAKRATRKNLE